MPPGYLPPIPERFGALSAGYGLMFTCARCTRGAAWPKPDLIKRWGEEGRVAAIAARFRCSNCKRQGAVVKIVPIRDYRSTEGDRARAKLEPIDRLMWDLERLKTSGAIE